MPVTIDGIKFSSKDIEGTDLEAIKKFCQKNKVKAANITYVDKDGMIENCGIYFNKEAHEQLKSYLGR